MKHFWKLFCAAVAVACFIVVIIQSMKYRDSMVYYISVKYNGEITVLECQNYYLNLKGLECVKDNGDILFTKYESANVVQGVR